MDEPSRTLLITLTGKDRPGVTSSIFSTLAALRGRRARHRADRAAPPAGARCRWSPLPRDWKALRAALERVAGDLGMQVDVGPRHRRQPAAAARAAATSPCSGMPLRAGGGRRDRRPDRRHRGEHRPDRADGALPGRPRSSCTCPGPTRTGCGSTLAEEAAEQSVDVAVQPATLLRHGMRLVVMDVDSTLVQGEVIEMLAAHAGCLERGRRGHRARDARRAGLRAVAARAGRAAGRARRGRARQGVRRRWRSTPGARTLVRTLKRLGYRFAIVSGGFTQVTDRLAARPGHRLRGRQHARGRRRRADRPDRRPGRGPGGQGRRAAPLRRRGRGRRGRRPSRSATAPTTWTCWPRPGSASRSTPSRWCSSAADTAVNVPYLDAILYLLGISREEVEAADALEGLTTPEPELG